jgi:hypothetical protein
MSKIPRVIFDGSGSSGSPLLISASGSSAATAQFNSLVFNGNQPPLRLWGTGFTTVDGMSWNEHLGGQNVRESAPIAILAVPAGFAPIFLTAWRCNDGLGRVYTPSSQGSTNSISGGGGGAICSNNFIGTCYHTGAPGAPTSRPPVTFVNYAVFQNYL